MSGRKRPGKRRINYGKKTRDLFKGICEGAGNEELSGSRVHEIIGKRSRISDNNIREHLGKYVIRESDGDVTYVNPRLLHVFSDIHKYFAEPIFTRPPRGISSIEELKQKHYQPVSRVREYLMDRQRLDVSYETLRAWASENKRLREYRGGFYWDPGINSF